MGAAVARRPPQPVAVADEAVADEGDQAGRRLRVARLAQDERGVGERPKRQAVPRGQLLVVARRPRAARPGREQRATGTLDEVGRRLDPPGQVEDVRALPVAGLGKPPVIGQ